MVKAWGDKAAEDQDFNEFYKAISAVLYSTGSKFRMRAKLLKQVRHSDGATMSLC